MGETNTSYDYSSLLTQGLYDSFLGRNKTTNGTFSDLNAGGTLSQSTQTASKVEIVFTDRTNERMWKYTMIVSPSGSKNAMTIERLY
ncbi:MAG: hypothetical protein H6766_07300 [Candidatus Peribacteria bacterium]|nr:MAG: hypothetical protein H6766_07300 [Candidatus Peribacteria bacterium]